MSMRWSISYEDAIGAIGSEAGSLMLRHPGVDVVQGRQLHGSQPPHQHLIGCLDLHSIIRAGAALYQGQAESRIAAILPGQRVLPSSGPYRIHMLLRR